ncbi:MAG TPA: hypothetical protein VIH90_02590 [Candidatus Saccharimonadales bacterium]
MVDLLEKDLHLITEELVRWRVIIGDKYLTYFMRKDSNRLLDVPQGLNTS